LQPGLAFAFTLIAMKTVLPGKVPPLVIAALMASVAVAEPPLPVGLGGAPAQPADLGGAPALPAGLGGAPAQPAEPGAPLGDSSPAASAPDRGLPKSLAGFWEARAGIRAQDDPHQKDASIGETRLQLRCDLPGDGVAFKLVTDFVCDPVADDYSVDLEEGVKLGRQINTWGTGDQLFINDLFPKDWHSFFIGRDDEYLKAPSDALKAAFFSDVANLDVVYMPRFDADRGIDGRRISYWNAGIGRAAGRDAPMVADKPDDWFEDDEWALRLFRNVGAYEVALYGYDGFWKSPGGSDPETGRALHPRLHVFGASSRGPAAGGIVSVEGGWCRSGDDDEGDDPFIRNSELRGLVGFEREIAPDLTGGLQYYVEHMLDYDAYKASLPADALAADELRQVVTVRLTRLLMNQNLKLGLFVFYSPTDDDAYLRPNANYKVDDYWTVEVGGNVFLGKRDDTFFGQFQDANNLYVSVRYGF
jgi:hypothetical protein